MKKLLIFWLTIVSFSAFSQQPLPELWGLHVHDDARILTQETVDHLETQLKAFEDSTSNQIAVLIISSLEGENLEEYSLRVSEKWQLGNKEKDNGVLLLIAIDDHKMRIETGQGLEGVLTDALCNQIIRNEMAPNFRKNDYDTGVTLAVNAIMNGIGGEYKADETIISGGDAAELSLKERILIGAFIFGILGIFTFIGLFVPGSGGWFLYAFLIPFYATFPWVVLGLTGGLTAFLVYLVGFPILKILLRKTAWGKRFIKKMENSQRNNNGGGGWSSGSGWSGGGSSGGSSSSGGFSGGGGSFSGGGSSGSW
jgi:uncharacterized protein